MRRTRRHKPQRTLHFEDAARFNYVLDTDEELQNGMTELASEFPRLTEEEYTEKFLRLLRCAGLDLSAGELKAPCSFCGDRPTRCFCTKKNRRRIVHPQGKRSKTAWTS